MMMCVCNRNQKTGKNKHTYKCADYINTYTRADYINALIYALTSFGISIHFYGPSYFIHTLASSPKNFTGHFEYRTCYFAQHDSTISIAVLVCQCIKYICVAGMEMRMDLHFVRLCRFSTLSTHTGDLK